ncbi:MAG: hypothetical protein CMG74_02390, partial [Candidatus Marinimicrobia bacterium]|nr:hypothetical protein [Candidatus Neomarinimicrobiota bacterium]
MKKTLYILIFLSGFTNSQTEESAFPASMHTMVKEVNTERVPRRISYQGLLTKTNGQAVKDGYYRVSFRFYKEIVDGNPFWEESQQINIDDGIISAILGKEIPIYAISGEAYLEIEIDGNIMSPRQELTSVFYSVISDTAKYAQKAVYTDLDSLPDLTKYLSVDTLSSYPLVSGFDSVAFTGDYNDLRNLPDLDNLVLDTLSHYTLTTDLSATYITIDTLANYQSLNFDLSTIANLRRDNLTNHILVTGDTSWIALSGDTARSALGLAIGSDVQPYDDDLTDLADGSLSADKVQHGEFFINSAGTSGHVWASDGDGTGEWINIGGAADSVKADDIRPGDAEVKITTTLGGVDITPASGSSIILDGTVNVDGGVITGATSITSQNIIATAGVDISGASGITLSKDETITNTTDGTVLITSPSTALSGDLTVTGNDITFGNGENISNGIEGSITFGTSGTDQIGIIDGEVSPIDDNDIDLGNSTSEFKDLYIDGVAYVDAIGLGTTSITLPTTDGSANQVLRTDGSGNLSWVGVGAADSVMADDIRPGDSEVTINTTSGGVNITPGTGSAVVLDGTINVDAGVLTGATSITTQNVIATTGIDVSGSGGITLSNDETITNTTDGTVLITSPTTSLSGDLTVTGNDITFGNGESISNGTDGSVTVA